MIPNKLTINFLKIGIFALGAAGIYSIILVTLRTPYLASLISNPQIFKIALITHVNLSVLVWLMSFTCAVWSLRSKQYQNVYLYLVFIGALLIAISPIIGGKPIMNNYVPMLENIIFVLGLSLFLIAIFLFSIQNISVVLCITKKSSIIHSTIVESDDLRNIRSFDYIEKFIDVSIVTSSAIFIAASICFITSYMSLSKIIQIIEIEIEYYYELLFWSFGHIIQFLYTQILMTIWIIILGVTTQKKFKQIYIYLLLFNLILSLIGILGHFQYDIISQEFKEYYTLHMKYVAGICPTICLISVIWELINSPKFNNLYIIIIASAILFGLGGAVGYMINEINVTVPAHYHGMIVGISVAFMGFTYLLISNMFLNDKLIHNVVESDKVVKSELATTHMIPSENTRDNFSGVKSLNYNLSRFQATQIWIITLGQIIHISGLTIAGGYGALRKTTSMLLNTNAKFGLGLMGIGGAGAIVGGLMFVCICYLRLYSENQKVNVII